MFQDVSRCWTPPSFDHLEVMVDYIVEDLRAGATCHPTVIPLPSECLTGCWEGCSDEQYGLASKGCEASIGWHPARPLTGEALRPHCNVFGRWNPDWEPVQLHTSAKGEQHSFSILWDDQDRPFRRWIKFTLVRSLL